MSLHSHFQMILLLYSAIHYITEYIQNILLPHNYNNLVVKKLNKLRHLGFLCFRKLTNCTHSAALLQLYWAIHVYVFICR